MAWGSNITSGFDYDSVAFDPATAKSFGEADRKKTYNLKVANKRASIRDNFINNRSNKAHDSTKQELQDQLTQAVAELAEINKQIKEATLQDSINRTPTMGAINLPTGSANIRAVPAVNPNTQNIQDPYKGFREVPIFTRRGR